MITGWRSLMELYGRRSWVFLSAALWLSCGGGAPRHDLSVVEHDPDCEAGAVCDERGSECISGDFACRCTITCSGAVEADPEDLSEGRSHRPVYWSCITFMSGCPENQPEAGAACESEGLVCEYGHCGGARARCQDSRWAVLLEAPPP